MIFRQLTALGDWTFGQGVSGYATAEQAVELNIKTRLLSWKGDCFFGLEDFIDWLGRLDKGQETNLTNELKSVILQSFGVVSITSVTATLNAATRAYTGIFGIQTIYGDNFQLALNQSAGLPTTGS